MLKFVRLPLINMKQLVTNIKFSGFFEDKTIFEALQFQVAKEVLSGERLENDIKYDSRAYFQRTLARWALLLAVGLLTGLCAAGVDHGVVLLEKLRVDVVLNLMSDGKVRHAGP